MIGWSEGEEHRTIAATLIDISMGGFSAWVETFPPEGGPVWLRLDGETPTPWLKAKVVAKVKSGWFFRSRCMVRLRFLESCPYDFFKGAIDGFAREFTHAVPRAEKPTAFSGVRQRAGLGPRLVTPACPARESAAVIFKEC